jgi:hypothetical protein
MLLKGRCGLRSLSERDDMSRGSGRKRGSLPGEDDMKHQIGRILPGEDDIGYAGRPYFLGRTILVSGPAAITALPQGKISE